MSVRVITGDCRETLATLPDRSVQCCVTSPPYFGLRDYGHDGQIGLEPTPADYVAEMVAVFREVKRVLRDDGTCWLNLGDSYAGSGKGVWNASDERKAAVKETYKPSTSAHSAKAPEGLKHKDIIGIPWRVAFALQADGWYLRQDIIWAKPNPMPESVTDRCTKGHEYVFLLSKSARYFYDADAIREPYAPDSVARASRGRSDTHKWSDGPGGQTLAHDLSKICSSAIGANRRSVWSIPSQPYSGAHFATMPPALAETCIKAGSSERGQCPHCGAPWVRQTETERTKDPARHSGRAKVGCTDRMDADMPRMLTTTTTTGWAPSCACPAHEPIPQTILDPFGGAGTTALVADRLQRDAIICELNPAYAALARDRINGEAGLFSDVSE